MNENTYQILRRDQDGNFWIVPRIPDYFISTDKEKVVYWCEVLCTTYAATDYVVIENHTGNIIWERIVGV